MHSSAFVCEDGFALGRISARKEPTPDHQCLGTLSCLLPSCSLRSDLRFGIMQAIPNAIQRPTTPSDLAFRRPVHVKAAKRSTKPLSVSRLWLSPSQSTLNDRSCSRIAVCAAVLPLAAITAVQPAVAVAAPAWPAALTSCGVFIVCCAAAALLLAAIPVLWSMVRTANRMESMLQTLEAELPDTAASMRLSSLELSDCLNELGALGTDLSSGVRASARLVSSAESGLRQGAHLLSAGLVPALARRETQLRDCIEAALKARADLAPEVAKARAAVVSTTRNVRRVRGAIYLSRLAGSAINMGRAFRRSLAVVAAERLAAQDAEVAAVRRWQQQQLRTGRGDAGSDKQQQQPRPA